MAQKSSDYLMMPGFTAKMSLYNTSTVPQSLSGQESFVSTMVIPAQWCPSGRVNDYRHCMKECWVAGGPVLSVCRSRCWNEWCDVEPE
jgi:hypothetical protein